MVVLDGSSVMSTTSGNQYLSPDYPPPLPSALDAKNSPLALLAQTCSQIGADSSNPKPSMPSERSKKSSNTSSSSSNDRSPSVLSTGISKISAVERKSPESRLAFKPYEANVLSSKKTENLTKPSLNSVDSVEDRKCVSRTSSRKSASSSPHQTASSSSGEKSLSPSMSGRDSGKSSSPTERPPTTDAYGTSATKESSSFKPTLPLNPLGALNCAGCPPLDPSNPAFRSPFALGSHFPHPSILDCFQSPTSLAASYGRMKTPTGSDQLMAVCKDPYCFSCRLALHGAVTPCPPGCIQCEQKYTAAAAAAAAALMSHPLSYQYGRPYVCSWVTGDSYCGKRFRTSDELFQHLRTHTSANDALAFMNQLRYPTGALTSLTAAAAASAARYHPYAKPGTLPMSPLTASPFSAFNPALSPYYPPYALYDQRIGAAVNP